MYKELTEKIFASHGILKGSAKEEYLKTATHLNFSKYPLEAAITKALRLLLGRGVKWQIVPRGVWTGDAFNTFVVKVTHENKIYYFKYSTDLRAHLGMILSQAFYTDHPEEKITAVKILDHGQFSFQNNNSFYFLLLKEAPGLSIVGLFKQKNYSDLLHFSSVCGTLLGKIQSQNISEATLYDKLSFSSARFPDRQKTALFLKEKIDEKAHTSIYENYLRIIPLLLEHQKTYLLKHQNKTLSSTISKIANLSFNRQNEVLTLFDTARFTLFCGPSAPPISAPELSFTEVINYLYFAQVYFDLDESSIRETKDAFLNNYHNNLQKPVMSKEGICFFLNLHFKQAIRRLIEQSIQEPHFLEKANRMLTIFEKFNEPGNKDLDKYLGY